MSILAWLFLGLLAGFIASKIVNGTGAGIGTDMLLGVVGAFVGGGVFHFFGNVGVTGFNVWSVMVASIGAVLVLTAYHALSGSPRRIKA